MCRRFTSEAPYLGVFFLFISFIVLFFAACAHIKYNKVPHLVIDSHVNF